MSKPKIRVIEKDITERDCYLLLAGEQVEVVVGQVLTIVKLKIKRKEEEYD